MDFDKIFFKIEELENRIKALEEENIGMTNALYELENSIESRPWAHPESSLSLHWGLGDK